GVAKNSRADPRARSAYVKKAPIVPGRHPRPRRSWPAKNPSPAPGHASLGRMWISAGPGVTYFPEGDAMTTTNQSDRNPHAPEPRPETPVPTKPSANLDGTLSPNSSVTVNPPAGTVVAKSPVAARPPVRKPSG